VGKTGVAAVRMPPLHSQQSETSRRRWIPESLGIAERTASRLIIPLYSTGTVYIQFVMKLAVLVTTRLSY
jgi:hypothetical protein